MIINRNFKEFKFRHRNKKNQIIYTSKKVKNDNFILDLIDNFLTEKNNIYLAKITNILYQNIKSKKEKLEEYISKQNTNTKNSILKSYDLFLNEKYNVVLNQKTIERVKNFFK